MKEFYDEVFGAPALAKFVNVGGRKGHSREHTLAALQMVYDIHQKNPFKEYMVMGHMVHATAAKLHRQQLSVEIDIVQRIERAMKKPSWLRRQWLLLRGKAAYG